MKLQSVSPSTRANTSVCEWKWSSCALVTNKLVNILGEEDFTWGSSSIDQEGIVRSNYIQALRNADNHDFTPLLRFARS